MPCVLNCTNCGKQFEYKRSYPRYGNAYCSKDCMSIARFGHKSLGKFADNCVNCERVVTRHHRTDKKTDKTYCSQKCYHAHHRGENHGQWNGGRFVSYEGYVFTRKDGKTRPEHIRIAESALGRGLAPGEVVHHVNGNKRDNRNSNLLICDYSYHAWLHQRMSQLYQEEHFGRA